MSRARLSSRVFFALIGVVTALFLAQHVWRSAPLFTDVLTRGRVSAFASLTKLGPQLLGSVFAARCARRYGKSSAARTAWILMSAWLGSWFAGQLVLVTYDPVLGIEAPVPSLADLFFAAGYVCVIVALFTFATAYRKSGFAVGSARQDVALALAACAVFGVVCYRFLLPVALTPAPFLEQLVNVGYPLLDLVTFIPALVILRITLGFRGGGVWRVWGALLAGIVFATGGDIVFSDVSPAHLDAVGPIADLFYALGYSFCAYGMRLQYELMVE